jgi:RNA polymerase sigma-70 factor (ECF subfamily)
VSARATEDGRVLRVDLASVERHRAARDADGGEHGVADGRGFEERFRALFAERHAALFRYLARLGGDAALAADLAQESFVRLYQRGSMPGDPAAWLVTVASNLFRSEHQRRTRRARLLGGGRGVRVMADPPPLPDAAAEAAEERRRVRAALDALPMRERQLLLLHYEGCSYRELAAATGVRESSVGTLLARAREAFRKAITEGPRAPD